ncbi:MAG: LCP family protein, partial [Candidatus Limnocylindrales bacterium]
GQAFLDTRWAGSTGRLGVGGLAIIAILVVLPHMLVYWYGSALGSTFGRVFIDTGTGGAQASAPPLDERINVLLVGIDKTRLRDNTLTDTMIVASLDPVGRTVTLLSIPRDLIRVPLGDGDRFGPKINSLMAYADERPHEFPDGGMAALRGALGSLLDIDIPYYAEVRFGGFIRMVDAVGGVDVTVDKGFDDPTYDGYGFDARGFSIKAGRQHLDGISALAFARARKAVGESDFTRAARQQQILLALRQAVTADGSLLFKVPELLDVVGESVRTDLPVALLPQLAAIVDEVEDADITKSIIRHPLVKSRNTEFGSSLVPDLKAIRAVAATLFPAPGVDPIAWPTPKPTRTPKPSPSG